MKSQDVLLLFKLLSLERQSLEGGEGRSRAQLGIPGDWQGWRPMVAGPAAEPGMEPDAYSVRALAESTGISKSEVSSALRRCFSVGLAKPDRRTGVPRVNTKGLYEFVVYGIRYVFPAHPGPMVRGIPTAHAAPVLAGRLLSAGEHVHVWEDVDGEVQGQRVEPLFRSVPFAVRRDAELYAMLALTDSIRLGREREAALARKLLANFMGRPDVG